MNKNIVLLFGLVILVACSASPSLRDPAKNTQQPTLSSSGSPPGANPTYHVDPIPPPDPTYKALYEDPGPVNDGGLTLTVKSVKSGCLKKDQKNPMKFVFTNISGMPLNVPRISPGKSTGEIEPVLTSPDGSILFFQNRDLGSPLKGKDQPEFVFVPSKASFEMIEDYFLPRQVLKSLNDEYDYAWLTPAPGAYLLKFVVQYYGSPGFDVWTGIVASNQITICVE